MLPTYATATLVSLVICRCTEKFVWYVYGHSKSVAIPRIPPPGVYAPVYGNGSPPASPRYGLLKLPPVANFPDPVFVNFSRVANGSKFDGWFQLFPERLP